MNTYRREGLLRVCFGDQQLCELKALLTTSSRITSVLGSVEVRYNVGGLDQRKLDTQLIVPPINPATGGATSTPPQHPQAPYLHSGATKAGHLCLRFSQRLNIANFDMNIGDRDVR